MAKAHVVKQLKYLILQSIHDDEDYQKIGYTSDNALACLIENKKLWFQVGDVRDNKQFHTMLKGTLSHLDQKDGYLTRNDKMKYFKSASFEEGLDSLIGELVDYLELDIEIGNYTDSEKKEIIKKIGDGSIEVGVLSSHNNTKISMLTNEQVTRFAQMAVERSLY